MVAFAENVTSPKTFGLNAAVTSLCDNLVISTSIKDYIRKVSLCEKGCEGKSYNLWMRKGDGFA